MIYPITNLRGTTKQHLNDKGWYFDKDHVIKDLHRR